MIAAALGVSCRTLTHGLASYVHSPKFEVSSDVLTTLRDLFTTHKGVVVTYLTNHYEEVSTCGWQHCWGGGTAAEPWGLWVTVLRGVQEAS